MKIDIDLLLRQFTYEIICILHVLEKIIIKPYRSRYELRIYRLTLLSYKRSIKKYVLLTDALDWLT